jgi:hypothetical protein
LTDGRNIRSSSTLSDILVLDAEVLTYSTSTAGYSRILVANGFEVLILPYLRKGNSSAVDVDNPSVKLKVVGGSETLTFLS